MNHREAGRLGALISTPNCHAQTPNYVKNPMASERRRRYRRTREFRAAVAQTVEHSIRNGDVSGSIPLGGPNLLGPEDVL